MGKGEERRRKEEEEEERDKKGKMEERGKKEVGEKLFKHSYPNFLSPGERRHVP